ncbi:DUF7691 family protein [Streptomyces sp. NPDC001732]
MGQATRGGLAPYSQRSCGSGGAGPLFPTLSYPHLTHPYAGWDRSLADRAALKGALSDLPGDLLPGGYLFDGLPHGFPGIPCPADRYPAVGHLPLDRVKPAADAYGDVLARMDPDFWGVVQELMEKLEFEHEEWWYAKHRVAGYTQDTLFFSLT